jgi:hypothetical protein
LTFAGAGSSERARTASTNCRTASCAAGASRARVMRVDRGPCRPQSRLGRLTSSRQASNSSTRQQEIEDCGQQRLRTAAGGDALPWCCSDAVWTSRNAIERPVSVDTTHSDSARSGSSRAGPRTRGAGGGREAGVEANAPRTRHRVGRRRTLGQSESVRICFRPVDQSCADRAAVGAGLALRSVGERGTGGVQSDSDKAERRRKSAARDPRQRVTVAQNEGTQLQFNGG